MKNNLFKLVGLSSVFGFALAAGAVVSTSEEQSEAVAENTLVTSDSFSCADPMAQDENSVLAAAYTTEGAECMFVGCGGVF